MTETESRSHFMCPKYRGSALLAACAVHGSGALAWAQVQVTGNKVKVKTLNFDPTLDIGNW